MNEFKNTEVVKIQDTDNSKCWGGFGAKWTLICLLMGMWNGTATWADRLTVSYKIKHALNIQSNSTTFSYSKELETYVNTNNLHR